MTSPQFQACIDACNACALACDDSAAASLHEPNVQAMADCVMLDMDCAAICRLAVSYMENDSQMTPVICNTCAEICERCQEECAKYQMNHCKACAEMCRVCAMECHALAELTVGNLYHQSPDANVAGLRQ